MIIWKASLITYVQQLQSGKEAGTLPFCEVYLSEKASHPSVGLEVEGRALDRKDTVTRGGAFPLTQRAASVRVCVLGGGG